MMVRSLKALDGGDGEALWSAGSLMVVKATGEDTHGGLTVIEQECPGGLVSPAHQHDDEEQCLYLLAGSLTLTCGDAERHMTPGSFAVLPRGLPHSFVVGSEGARFLSLTTPAGFEEFARAIGAPAVDRVPPPDPVANMQLASDRVATGSSDELKGRAATSDDG
jgi:quercetin dioxygenase-like cupin family protein